MILGFDGGMRGGISFITDDGEIDYSIPFPIIKGGKGTKSQYNIQKITNLVIEAKRKDSTLFAVLEHAQVTPLAGKVACFMMGYYLGMIQGIKIKIPKPLDIRKLSDGQYEVYFKEAYR